MDFAYSEEQQMLRDGARRFLEERAPSARVRQLMETDTGFDSDLWQEIARQGWQAMHIPEEYGGAGFGYVELGVLQEEMGRALFPAPYFGTVVLGANAILVAGGEEQKKEILPAVAAGERRLALAQLEPDGSWEPDAVRTAARRDGDDWVIDGTKAFVVDGHTAGTLLVAARHDDGVGLFLVDGDAAGVTRRRVESMDMTRKLAEVSLDGVRVPGHAVLGDGRNGVEALEKVADLAAVALAAEQVGGAEKCLEMSVEYAKVRVQFGRPIGSFQAVKHKCADMLVQVEMARSASMYASWAAGADEEELAVMAPLAKSVCSEAYLYCAGENIQVHGGIGFTWEHDAHLYFKRAKSSELMLGTPAYQRRLLAERLGL